MRMSGKKKSNRKFKTEPTEEERALFRELLGMLTPVPRKPVVISQRSES